MTKPRLGRALLAPLFFAALALPVFVSVPAHARATAHSQSATPTPSATPTASAQVNAKNAIVGLLFLTGCAAGGYYTAKVIRRRQGRPRPPGPWFGGRRK